MTQDHIFKKRLLKLASFLDRLPPERFNFSTWVGDNWKGSPDLSCGTTACAFGWATTIPAFRKAGLRMEKVYGCGSVGVVTLKGLKISAKDRFIKSPMLAAKKIFGLSPYEYYYLFVPITVLDGNQQHIINGYPRLDSSVNASMTAFHIRRFVRAKYL